LIRELKEKDVKEGCRGQRRSEVGGVSDAVAPDDKFQGAAKLVEIESNNSLTNCNLAKHNQNQ